MGQSQGKINNRIDLQIKREKLTSDIKHLTEVLTQNEGCKSMFDDFIFKTPEEIDVHILDLEQKLEENQQESRNLQNFNPYEIDGIKRLLIQIKQLEEEIPLRQAMLKTAYEGLDKDFQTYLKSLDSEAMKLLGIDEDPETVGGYKKTKSKNPRRRKFKQ